MAARETRGWRVALVRVLRALAPWAAVTVVLAVPTWFQVLPSPDHLGDRFATNTGDPVLMMWSLKTQAHVLIAHPSALMQGNIFYPHADTLAYSDNLLLYGVVFGPSLAVSGDNAVFAYNMVTLVFYVAGALAVYALALHLLGRRLPALGAAIVFTLSPFRSAAVGHVEMSGFLFVPLTLLFLMRFLEGRRWRDAALVGACAAGAGLSNLYSAVMLVLIVPVFSAAWLVQHRTALGPRLWRGAGLGGAVAAALVAPVVPALVRLERSGLITRSPAEIIALERDGFSHLPPSVVYSHLPVTTAPLEDIRAFYPGAVLMVLVALALVGLVAFPRRQPPGEAGGDDTHARRRREYALPLLASGLAACAVIVGPNHRVLISGADRVLRRVVPGMANVRDLSRFWLIPLLVLSLVAGLGILLVGRRLGRRAEALLAVAVVVVASLELVYRPPFATVAQGEPATTANHALSRLPAGPVVELPLPPVDTFAFAFVVTPRQLRSLVDGNPRVEGYTGETPADVRNLIALARTFPSEQSVDALRLYGVRYVVLHGGSQACAGYYSPDEMVTLRRQLGSLSGVDGVSSEGSDLIVTLTAHTVDRAAVPTAPVVAGRDAPLCDLG